MANRTKVTQQKRARERAKQERHAGEDTASRRGEDAESQRTAAGSAGDEDPDIAGIIPGPQPSPGATTISIDDRSEKQEE